MIEVIIIWGSLTALFTIMILTGHIIYSIKKEK